VAQSKNLHSTRSLARVNIILFQVNEIAYVPLQKDSTSTYLIS